MPHRLRGEHAAPLGPQRSGTDGGVEVRLVPGRGQAHLFHVHSWLWRIDEHPAAHVDPDVAVPGELQDVTRLQAGQRHGGQGGLAVAGARDRHSGRGPCRAGQPGTVVAAPARPAGPEDVGAAERVVGERHGLFGLGPGGPLVMGGGTGRGAATARRVRLAIRCAPASWRWVVMTCWSWWYWSVDRCVRKADWLSSVRGFPEVSSAATELMAPFS